jgi:hypothetical protein
MVETAFPFAKQLECILCVMGPKRKLLSSAYRRMNISSVVIAHTYQQRPTPVSLRRLLLRHGGSGRPPWACLRAAERGGVSPPHAFLPYALEAEHKSQVVRALVWLPKCRRDLSTAEGASHAR